MSDLDEHLNTQQLTKLTLDSSQSDLVTQISDLEKHSQVITARNHELYQELDAYSKTDDFVRESLKRTHIVQSIKFRN